MPSVIRIGSFDVNLLGHDLLANCGSHRIRGILKGCSVQVDESLIQEKDDDIQSLERLTDRRIAASMEQQSVCTEDKEDNGSSDAYAGSDLQSYSGQLVSVHNSQFVSYKERRKDESLNPESMTHSHCVLNVVLSLKEKSLMAVKLVKRAKRLGGCTRCFRLDHNCFECREDIRCAGCFNYGHKFNFCLTNRRPRICWRPKLTPYEKPTIENEKTIGVETDCPDNGPSPIDPPSQAPESEDGLDDGTTPSFAAGLELSLPEKTAVGATPVDRQLQVTSLFSQCSESDYHIRGLAKGLQLHRGFGPAPSVEVLLREMAWIVREAQRLLPMKKPLPATSWSNVPPVLQIDPWLIDIDNPVWKNNAEAYTSSGIKAHRIVPRNTTISNVLDVVPLQIHGANNKANYAHHQQADQHASLDLGLSNEVSVNHAIVVYDQNLAVSQIMHRLRPLDSVPPSQGSSVQTDMSFQTMWTDMGLGAEEVYDVQMQNGMEQMEEEALAIQEEIQASGHGTPHTVKKRKGRGKTPIVDDEVRRCSRFKSGQAQTHVVLDREPRRKKGEAKKTVSIITVEDLKSAVITRNLEEELNDAEVEPIQAPLLIEFGNSFCGVPPEELNLATFQSDDESH